MLHGGKNMKNEVELECDFNVQGIEDQKAKIRELNSLLQKAIELSDELSDKEKRRFSDADINESYVSVANSNALILNNLSNMITHYATLDNCNDFFEDIKMLIDLYLNFYSRVYSASPLFKKLFNLEGR